MDCLVCEWPPEIVVLSLLVGLDMNPDQTHLLKKKKQKQAFTFVMFDTSPVELN